MVSAALLSGFVGFEREARQVEVDKTDDDDFLVSFNLRPDRIATATSALGAYESVIDAAEMDPK